MSGPYDCEFPCPNCQNMITGYTDTMLLCGTCYECGFDVHTKQGYLSLAGLNEIREDYNENQMDEEDHLPPLTKLPEQDPEYGDSYETHKHIQVLEDKEMDEWESKTTVKVDATPNGIVLSSPDFKGYTSNEFAMVEVWQGELRLLVWANKDDEEVSHIIPLAQLKNLKLKEEPDGGGCNTETQL